MRRMGSQNVAGVEHEVDEHRAAAEQRQDASAALTDVVSEHARLVAVHKAAEATRGEVTDATGEHARAEGELATLLNPPRRSAPAVGSCFPNGSRVCAGSPRSRTAARRTDEGQVQRLPGGLGQGVPATAESSRSPRRSHAEAPAYVAGLVANLSQAS